MTDDEIHAAIAKALGLVRYQETDTGFAFWSDRKGLALDNGLEPRRVEGETRWHTLPDWLHSLDACYRDLPAIVRSRDPEAGLTLTGDGSGRWWAYWTWHDNDEFRYDPAYAAEPARAVCMATLAALGIDAEAEAVAV